jgi:sec-independent protein translocase protein TatA
MVGDIFQPTHLLFVLVVALLVLGPKKLPEVGRQLGNGIRDFRAAINGERTEREEVPAPYEQAAPDTAAAHEFGHEPSVEDTASEHEFAGADTASKHEFVHESSAGHEFAHEPETAAADAGTAGDEKPTTAHEFAYETSEPSDKRTHPPA